MYVIILYINRVLKYVKIFVTELSSLPNIFQKIINIPFTRPVLHNYVFVVPTDNMSQ